MADIEEADSEDQGRVRHWLAQALRAPRDPEWVADGQVSQHWLPISPVTGRLDAFEWKVPVSSNARPAPLAPAASEPPAPLPPGAAPVAPGV